MTFLGLDPGAGGGIAALIVEGRGTVVKADAWKMPETDRDILDSLEPYVGPHTFAFLEKVHSMPKQGVVSAFTFGGSYRALKMALTALRIPYDLVTPQRWQLIMGCRTGGDKNVSKRRAQELFPAMKMTHALADALLIAEFGRRTH